MSTGSWCKVLGLALVMKALLGTVTPKPKANSLPLSQKHLEDVGMVNL
jgi:hypothetical protein